MYEIKHRVTGEVLCRSDAAEGARDAAIEAASKKADLAGADLTGADLTGACLTGANLTGADLSRADLAGANLSRADLYGACLHGADLRGAYLYGAYLYGAYLYGADLRGAKIDWNSHDLIAEILRQEAADDVERRKFAGLVLISQDWCWDRFLRLADPQLDWALDTLAAWIQEGDNAPECLTARRKTETQATA